MLKLKLREKQDATNVVFNIPVIETGKITLNF